MSSHRLFFIVAALIFTLTPLYSQSVQFDTVSIDFIGDGIKHLHYRTALPQQIHVAEIDLTDPSLSIESVRHNGLALTSQSVKERSSGNGTVVAAINGDFFSFTDSIQVNNQVSDFLPVTGYTIPHRSAFGVLADRRVIFDGFTFRGSIITQKKNNYSFDRLNRNRTLSEITVYTEYRGATTRTDSGGVEIVLQSLGYRMWSGDTVKFSVLQADKGVNSGIPKNGAVISFGRSDTASRFLSEFKTGDTVNIMMDVIPVHDTLTAKLRSLVSGWGRLLVNGKNLPALADSNERLTAKFTAVRHPRTFLGFNADTTKLYLCVVDGRQEQSVGMTFLEMSNFLQAIGVTNAINLDGGGSTTLVFDGKIVNSPSDKTGERPVANSIQVVRSLQQQ